MVEIHEFARYGEQLKTLIELSSSAVGVRFLAGGEQPVGARVLKHHRYCQALMRARRGESVWLGEGGIACPAAAAAFGFRLLPAGLQTGKGLVGFGTVADEIAEAALRQALGVLRKHMNERYGLGRTATMSPGSLPDWPIQAQRPLFALFGKAEELLGVRLTDSLLMIPSKSVSGIRFPTEQTFASCQLCPRAGCPSRQSPYDGELYDKRYRVSQAETGLGTTKEETQCPTC